MDSPTTVPGTLSTTLLADYHHTSIIELSVCGSEWKVGEGLPDRARSKAKKMVVVYSSETFNINRWLNGKSALCLYIVMRWGVISCVCGMAFLCGSTLVKVSLLQVGTVAI